MGDVLDKVKTLIGLDDDKQDAQLGVIINNIENHLKYLIEKDAVPDYLQYIVIEISVRRYNRLGSEGMRTDSEEGHSVTFYDLKDDFEPYTRIIDRETERDGLKRRQVKFF